MNSTVERAALDYHRSWLKVSVNHNTMSVKVASLLATSNDHLNQPVCGSSTYAEKNNVLLTKLFIPHDLYFHSLSMYVCWILFRYICMLVCVTKHNGQNSWTKRKEYFRVCMWRTEMIFHQILFWVPPFPPSFPTIPAKK